MAVNLKFQILVTEDDGQSIPALYRKTWEFLVQELLLRF